MSDVVNEILSQIEPEKFRERSIPIPDSGFIRSFVNAANASSRFDVSCIAVGGALSLLSVIAANRVKHGITYSNLYSLALAPSGLGKGSVVRLLKDVLSGTNLLGADMYRSSQSYIATLTENPERLDVLDEAGAFFEAMKSTTSYTSDLPDILNRLFSASGSFFGGISSVKHGKNSGVCWSPCVSLYATVHQTGFLRSVQGYLGKSGLIPRFLIFEQSSYKRNEKKFTHKEYLEMVKELQDFVQKFMSKYPKQYESHIDAPCMQTKEGIDGRRPVPFEMEMLPEAQMLIDLYLESIEDDMIAGVDPDEDPYKARLGEYVAKVALLACLARDGAVIHEQDVNYAMVLVESCRFNSQFLRKEISCSTNKAGRVINYIKRKGQVSRTDLIKNLDLSSRQLDDLLSPFLEEGLVLSRSEKTARKSRTFYFFPTDTEI